MKKILLLLLLMLLLVLTGCMGFFYRMNRLEEKTFAPELSDANDKNLGLDTIYDVSAASMTLEQIQEKAHPAARGFLMEFIQKDQFDYKKHLKFNLVEGYIMDAAMKRDDENAPIYLLHVNFGGEKDDALRNKLKAAYDVWHIDGRVTRIMRRIGEKITYDMDVEKKYELEYYDNGQLMSEFRGDFLNNTEGVVRYNGKWTIYSERGQKAVECEISDTQVDKENCKNWDEPVDLEKIL